LIAVCGKPTAACWTAAVFYLKTISKDSRGKVTSSLDLLKPKQFLCKQNIEK